MARRPASKSRVEVEKLNELAQFSSDLKGSSTFRELVAAFEKLLTKEYPEAQVTVWFYHQHAKRLLLHYWTNWPNDPLMSQRSAPETVPLVTRIMESQQSLAIPDLANEDASFYEPFASRPSLSSILSLPLHRGGDFLGIVNICLGKPHQWSPDERVFFEVIISQLSFSLERVMLIDESRWLQEVYLPERSPEQLKDMLRRVLQKMLSELDCTRCALFTYGWPDLGRQLFAAAGEEWLDPDPLSKFEQAIAATVIEKENVIYGYGLQDADPFGRTSLQQSIDYNDAVLCFESAQIGSILAVRLPSVPSTKVSTESLGGLVLYKGANVVGFSPFEEEMIFQVARRIATALEDAKLREELDGLAEQYEAIGVAFTNPHGLDNLLKRLLCECIRKTSSANGYIALKEAGDELRIIEWIGKPLGGQTKERTGRTRGGVIGRVVETGKAIRIGRNEKLRELLGSSIDSEGFTVESELCVPFPVEHGVIGAIDLYSGERDLYDETHEAFVSRQARTISVVIAASKRYFRTQSKLKALFETTAAIHLTEGRQEMLEAIIFHATDLFDGIGGAIQLVENGHLAIRGSIGIPFDREDLKLKFGQGLTGTAAKERKTVAVADIRKDPRYVIFIPETRSEIATPIMLSDKIIGVLSVDSDVVGSFRPDDEETISMIETLARQAAIALSKAELQETREKFEGAASAIAAGELASGIAHEARNSLGSIFREIKEIRRRINKVDKDDRGIRQRAKNKMMVALAKIDEHAHMIFSLVNPLTSISQSSQFQLGHVYPNQLVRDSVSLVRGRLKEKNISLDLRLAPALDPVNSGFGHPVLGDKGQLTRALVNLLLNAATASQGRGKIALQTYLRKEEDEAEIRVIDYGRGIPEEIIGKIWQAFFSGSGGTGLGLFLAQRIIVENHGGKLILRDSKPGKGTTFSILLKLERPEN